MVEKAPTLTVTKLEAGRRQLQTAIKLWFADGDPVSIHTLAYAAYEIIHVVSKKRNPSRRQLLFDNALVRKDKQREWADIVKKHANWFKHARNDAEGSMEFNSAISEIFLLYSIFGLDFCGEQRADEELAFIWWFTIHHPELLGEEGRIQFKNSIPVEALNTLKTVGKNEFLEILYVTIRTLGRP
jgi:hypothetical protein